jgi:uncharacterized repeat protein (TIGR03803 family)
MDDFIRLAAGNRMLRIIALFAFGITATAALLAGCGGGNVTPLNPSSAQHAAERRHASVAYSVIHSFGGSAEDGSSPYAGLVNVNGTLYGTTEFGGANDDGTVFSLTPTPSGTETTLYSFVGAPYDGAEPLAGLINVNGTLYGTTYQGGGGSCGIHTGCGTVFAVTRSGVETVIHSFGQNSAFPEGKLIFVKGTLYGTALGGAYSHGTVFAIPRFGSERTLYSFAGSPYDGASPKAGLVNLNGTLYGTTFFGGANCGSSGGCGTVFSITPSGAEAALHSFAGGSDGANPPASLVFLKGTLYGTTAFGGANGYGTVFAIPRFGAYTVLYSFAGGTDGANPQAGLINVNGTLYGTTARGGTLCGSIGGCGTIFSITPSGTETVLHSFGGSAVDGGFPYAGLLKVKNTLYGTTVSGGANDAGTVFSLTPQ